MDDLKALLSAHFARYPYMQSQDAVKLLYQGEFGPGHLTTCESGSFEHLSAQYEAACNDEPLNDYIGGGMSRVHLAAAKAQGICALTLYKSFLLSAKSAKGSFELFEPKLLQLIKISEKGAPFTLEELNRFLDKWRSAKMPIISHSIAYRERYKPAYRLLLERYANFMPLFAAIDKRLSLGKTTIIGIDGNCGSGKSTLASLLASVYENCSIIPMDHFFLPKAQQMPFPLDANIDLERFGTLVAPKIKCFEKFSYRPFNCSKGEYAQQVDILPDKLIIVEGSYCLHPKYSSLYDLKVFLECSKEEQLLRIKRRSYEKLGRFISEWIPAETRYFEQYNIKNSCDLVFTT